MPDLTRAQIRGKGYAGGKIPGMGFARTADSIATDGIVDSAAFEDDAAGEGDYSSTWIYRPGLSDPNQVKRAAYVSASKLVTEAPIYADARTDLAYELVGLLHPAIWNEGIRLAPRHVYADYIWPVGWHLDNDFAAPLTTTPHDWTSGAVNMTTVAKATTGNVYTQAGQTGPRNLILTGSAAGNGYVISSRKNVEPGDNLFHGAIGRSNGAYTASYVLYDVTNAAALETVTFASRAFQRIAMQTTIPSGCRQVEVRIGNVTASGVTEWDCLFGHLLGYEDAGLILPSWHTKRFQFYSFGPAEYGRQTATDLSNATSRRLIGWVPGLDYEPLVTEANATVSHLEVRRPLEATDYWLQAKRPHSSFETMEDEDDTINCDEDYLMPACYVEWAMSLRMAYPDAPEWVALQAWADGELARQRVVRQPFLPRAERRLVRIGMRPGG